MLGGMIAVTLHGFLPLPLAILGAVLITMIIGGLIEMTFIRWLVKPSVLRMIIITIGISILIREAALAVWGESVRSLPYFTGNEVSSLSFGGVRISPQVLWSIGVCSVVVLFLNLFFKYTMLGREMRACAANREAAALCGIPTKNMVTLSFVLSAGIGALAGCVVSPITYTQYNIGAGLAIKGFTVAILGGLGNSMAAVGAGFILGVLESFSIWVLPDGVQGRHLHFDSARDAVHQAEWPIREQGSHEVKGFLMRTSRFTPILCLAGTVVAVQLLTLALGKDFYLTQLTMTAYYSLVVVGLCLLMGFAGQISLGHAGFFTIGGYASAVLTTLNLSAYKDVPLISLLTRLQVLTSRQDLYGAQILSVHPWVACVVAALLALVISYAIGIPVLKLKGHYLAMATLGFGTIIFSIVLGTQQFGAADGISSVPPFPLSARHQRQRRLVPQGPELLLCLAPRHRGHAAAYEPHQLTGRSCTPRNPRSRGRIERHGR